MLRLIKSFLYFLPRRPNSLLVEVSLVAISLRNRALAQTIAHAFLIAAKQIETPTNSIYHLN